MTAPIPAPYDFVAFLATIGGLLFSNPALADALAPYAAIFFASLFGVMWSLSRRDADTAPGFRWRGALFIMKIVGAAMVITAPIATWIAPSMGFNPTYAVAPVSFLIGAVGDDWKEFLSWFLRWKFGGNKLGD